MHPPGKRKLSQTKLSALSGVPQPTINRILSGATLNPEAATVAALAAACGVTFGWLYEGHQPKLRTEDSQGSSYSPPLLAKHLAAVAAATLPTAAEREAGLVDPLQLTKLINLFAAATPEGRVNILESAEIADKRHLGERTVGDN